MEKKAAMKLVTRRQFIARMKYKEGLNKTRALAKWNKFINLPKAFTKWKGKKFYLGISKNEEYAKVEQFEVDIERGDASNRTALKNATKHGFVGDNRSEKLLQSCGGRAVGNTIDIAHGEGPGDDSPDGNETDGTYAADEEEEEEEDDGSEEDEVDEECHMIG